MAAQSTCAVLGFQVGSYQQLRDAVRFLKANNVPVIDVPAEFHTGIEYAAHFLDPEGHCIRLYHAIESVDCRRISQPPPDCPTTFHGTPVRSRSPWLRTVSTTR